MLFLNTQVPDEILIDRCVGRRLDPVTKKIYHIRNFPPETEEIKARLTTRPDDTEEKVSMIWHLTFCSHVIYTSYHRLFSHMHMYGKINFVIILVLGLTFGC